MTFNRALRAELAKYEVTFSQFQHLWQLWKEDGVPQFELSRRIGIENASSTAVIDQLEKRGFIARRRDAKDRRRIIVTLTAAGRSMQGALDECAVAVNSRARRGLSQEKIAAFFETAQRIIDNFHSSSGPLKT